MPNLLTFAAQRGGITPSYMREMEKILLKDKEFELFIPESRLSEAISRMALEIRADRDNANPLFVSILNGAFMFTAYLMRELNCAHELTFARYASYRGTSSSGELREIMPVNVEVRGRRLILLEDIVDTGTTMHFLKHKLLADGAADVKIAAMLHKPNALRFADAAPDYTGLEIPNDFIVGFGLDYDGAGRALRNIYKVKGL
jgi:hypoxanthine phosphoribosyltransferase